ncbi:hypothetical protein ACFYYB_27565 [Streptomyces sp. NPDC002886]|uniref:hypothetical protein n=1 Tax=Streptomyces sp. NPDC002886 TaxID=3364667 RepID=UPI00369F0A17
MVSPPRDRPRAWRICELPGSASSSAALLTGNRGIVHAFADWHILKTVRRRAARGRYTTGSASQDRTEVLRVMDFPH